MGNVVLVARSPWPLLHRASALLSAAGYSVVELPSWSHLLERAVSCPDLTGIILGEVGDTAGEIDVLRRFLPVTIDVVDVRAGVSEVRVRPR